MTALFEFSVLGNNLMKRNCVLGGLCLNFIILNLLDAIITITVLQQGLGAETNGFIAYSIRTFSLYPTMISKILIITVAMYIIYRLDGSYDSFSFWKYNIKGISIIYAGLVLINLTYYLVVINGLIAIFFPTAALFKAN